MYIYNFNDFINESLKLEEKIIIQQAKQNNFLYKSPNGSNTLLTKSLWIFIRTEKFKNFFGNWIDNNTNELINLNEFRLMENDEPKLIYHGSKSMTPFTEFNSKDMKKFSYNKFNTYLDSGLAEFFTDDINFAKQYRWNIKNYIKIKNIDKYPILKIFDEDETFQKILKRWYYNKDYLYKRKDNQESYIIDDLYKNNIINIINITICKNEYDNKKLNERDLEHLNKYYFNEEYLKNILIIKILKKIINKEKLENSELDFLNKLINDENLLNDYVEKNNIGKDEIQYIFYLIKDEWIIEHDSYFKINFKIEIEEIYNNKEVSNLYSCFTNIKNPFYFKSYEYTEKTMKENIIFAKDHANDCVISKFQKDGSYKNEHIQYAIFNNNNILIV